MRKQGLCGWSPLSLNHLQSTILASVTISNPFAPSNLVPPRDASYRHFWSFPCCQSAIPHLLQFPLLNLNT